MKSVHISDEDLPAGFERVRFAAGVTLLLPSETVPEVRAEFQRRAEEEESRARDELRKRQEEQQTQAARANLAATLVSEQPPILNRSQPLRGWYCVLPRFAELAKELEDGKAVERSADKDVNQRRRQILQKLLVLGPDRRVAWPKGWRATVNELEAALPHFRAPIRSLRNALALAEATETAPRMTPQLLLGPPGVGKTFFSHRVAELLGSAHASIHFDQPSAGAQLRGSDKYWANSEPGLLFNLLCLGSCANPVILLDEMDKSCGGSGTREVDPLTQLHSALERQTAKCMMDVSVEVEFDASLVAYIGTANSLRGIGLPLVSRMEVHAIEPPEKWESFEIARSIACDVLKRLGLAGQIEFDRTALCLLAHFSPRLMVRAAEQAVAAAVADERNRISEDELWREFAAGSDMQTH